MEGRRCRGERGQATFTLIFVLIIVAAAVFLLYRTESNAAAINGEATSIANTGRGINSDTDAVLQLTKTNRLATSILHSAQPLQGQLGQIVGLAQAIDGSATSINSSAGTINGTAHAIDASASSINGSAGSINGSANAISGDANSINSSAGAINNTAKGINATAASILTQASQIRHGVLMINTNLDVTIGLAQQILGDAGNIVNEASGALTQAACINKELNGGNRPPCR